MRSPTPPERVRFLPSVLRPGRLVGQDAGLSGMCPAEGGDPSAGSRESEILPARKNRRQADWAGTALIRRSSVVRFHGRRSPRSSAEEQGASTPRVAGSSPAGESGRERLVVGETGLPHRLRASEIAGSNPADQILALFRERRAVEERLSSRAS